ncbi:MAG: DUF5011 domain-containing protein [bacterium]|nr:DUF5011 domain-containing protein [bacterium]
MRYTTKKLAIVSIFFTGFILAMTAYAAADLEITQVGRNVTRGGAYSTTTVANAGTEVILINVDVRNLGDAGTSTSTTFAATLPAAIEYVESSTKYFGMACTDFVNGCPIADSASGTAFPLDDPYALGTLGAGDDITIQYKVKIVAGTQTALTIAGATVTDGSLSVSGAATVGTPDLPPAITLNGGSTINLFVGQTYTELGATATDETEGNISANITITGTVNTSVAGTYTKRYNVSDSRGNAAAEVLRQIIVSLDTTKPVITLLGSASVTLTVGDAYTDAGATATDNLDGNITSTITVISTVSTSTAGTYTVRYNVTDVAGNTAEEVVRTVVVNNPPAPAPVVVVQSSGGGGGGGGGGSAPSVAEVSNSTIKINGGAALSISRTVTLTLGAVNALEMMLANDKNFTGSAWESFAATKVWALVSGNGQKEVFVKFRDIGKNVAGPVSDSIALQEAGTVATVSTPAIQTTPKMQVTSGETFRFAINLSYGMSGEAVTELQKRLTTEGAYFGPITGYFGRLTLDGVKVYQKMKGLAASGFIGESTRNVLNASGTPRVAAPTPTSQPLSPELVEGAPAVSEEIVKAELRGKIKLLQAQLVNLLEQLAAKLKSRL